MKQPISIIKNGFKFTYYHSDQTESDALQRLNNVQVLTINDEKSINKTKVTVVCFGTFDLFHNLHNRLIRIASQIGDSLVVYIYGKNIKHPHNSDNEIKLTDSVQKRIENVTNCALQYFKPNKIQLKRMILKHLEQLNKLINKFHNKNQKIVLMGGVDQFQEYYKLLDLCYTQNVPIIAIDRGIGLCSTDIRNQIYYQRAAHIYGLDVEKSFWLRFNGKLYMGDDKPKLWKYNPNLPIDILVENPISDSNRIVVCLPGRTKCDWNRARKILTTNKEMLQTNIVKIIKDGEIFLANYTEDELSTTYHLNKLKESPFEYFSSDALWLTRMIIMPRLEQNDFWRITLWGRSRGSVIIREMENAFRYCCKQLNLPQEYVISCARQIAACTVSNLAPFEEHRLFTTVSITGTNDKKALEVIPELKNPNFIPKKTSTHYIHLVSLPREIWTDNHGKIEHIEDDDRHYTPLYMSIRIPNPQEENMTLAIDNSLSDFVHKTFQNMVARTAYKPSQEFVI